MAATDPHDKSAHEVEREVEATRHELETSIDALSDRVRPGALLEEGLAYLRDGDGAEFTRNLGREMRANPVPVLLIGIGVAWLLAAANRRDRMEPVSYRTQDPVVRGDASDPYARAPAYPSPVASAPPARPKPVETSGTQSGFNDMVTDLVHLERDALSAYDAAIERLADPAAKAKVSTFKADHVKHLEVLEEMGREAGAEVPAEGDAKEMLTTGKVVMAGLVGDAAILKAMKTNEDDTVAAYERAARHAGAQPRSVTFFEGALADERRHRDAMERMAEAL